MSLCPHCGMTLQPDEHDCAACREATTTSPKEDEFDDPPVEDETSAPRDVPDFEMTTPRWKRWRLIGYFLGYGSMALWALMPIIYPSNRTSFGESILIFVVGGTVFSFVIALAGAFCESFFGAFCDVMPFLRPSREDEAFGTIDDRRTSKRWGEGGEHSEDEYLNIDDDAGDEYLRTANDYLDDEPPHTQEEASPDGIQRKRQGSPDEDYHLGGDEP